MSRKPLAQAVTVLGAAGYIGGHLVSHLRSQNCPCWLPARDDPAMFERPLGTVFYCIGLTSDFRLRPFDTVDAHVGVLRQVLQRSDFDQLIYLSSTRVYQGADDTHESQLLRVDSAAADDLYKLSKLMGESLALHSGRLCKVVRLSNVVGGAHGNPDSFLYSLWREARSGQVMLQSDPSSAKDYIHIDDVVAYLLRIARFGQHRVYNLASGVQITHAQWLDRICAESGCQWQVAPDAAHRSFLPIRIDRLQSEFAYRPLPVLKSVVFPT